MIKKAACRRRRAWTGGADGGLSLATDIGLGVALENAQRSALMAVALAEAAGRGRRTRRGDAFYLALLKTVGCTGDEDLGARVFGEDSGNWIAHMGGAFTGGDAARAGPERRPRGDPRRGG